ncbi:hypothetical protein OMR07_26420 [Methylobacterium organophilum]|nr:hypothetical protein [Methylobacterium organophilum]
MPDNPLAISRVVVAVDGRRVAEVPASVIDEAFKRNGWHATGQCTFVVSEAEVPGLSEIPRLELYDADTNVLVYRRMPAPSVRHVSRRGRMPSGRAIAHFSVGVHHGAFGPGTDPGGSTPPARCDRL